MYKYLIFCLLLLTTCKEETDPQQVVSWTSLSAKHNIKDLLSYDYSKSDKVFVLGYHEGNLSGRYEVRDENFNILKEVKLDFTPYSLLYTKDSIYASRDLRYFATNNDMIFVADDHGSITLFNPKDQKRIMSYTDPAAAGTPFVSFNSFVETEQYYILSIYTITTCVFIDKSTFEVTTFADSFAKNNAVGGWSLVKNKQGDIILSTILLGMVVDGYLVYKNGTWEPFQSTTLPTTEGEMGFVDSRNYGWVNSWDNRFFKIYDLTNNQFINTKPEKLSGNYFGYTLREHSSGDILVKSGTLISTTYELMQIHFN